MKTAIHVTDLDQMIWYRKLESMTVDEMRGRLLRTDPPNDKMAMGTAWHSILENPPAEIDEIERDGFKFKVDCDFELLLPQVREIRTQKTYLVDGEKITLTGKCDGISGNKVDDHKLTFLENPETYFDSYQWRAYLDMFNANIFEYIIYAATQKGDVVTIKNISPMKMFRYPEMVDDLMVGILDLVEFIHEFVPELV